jgi:hypothetical protein
LFLFDEAVQGFRMKAVILVSAGDERCGSWKQEKPLINKSFFFF